MARWFKVEGTVQLLGAAVSLSTPDWTVTNPDHRPSWLPKWKSFDYTGQRVECRRMVMVTWFFHLTVWWGRQPEDDDGDET